MASPSLNHPDIHIEGSKWNEFRSGERIYESLEEEQIRKGVSAGINKFI